MHHDRRALMTRIDLMGITSKLHFCDFAATDDWYVLLAFIDPSGGNRLSQRMVFSQLRSLSMMI
jgi:hypothetical protein